MAKRVRWTSSAQSDRKDILLYWNTRNKSNTFTRKLNQLLIENIKLIQRHPKIGRLLVEIIFESV